MRRKASNFYVWFIDWLIIVERDMTLSESNRALQIWRSYFVSGSEGNWGTKVAMIFEPAINAWSGMEMLCETVNKSLTIAKFELLMGHFTNKIEHI